MNLSNFCAVHIFLIHISHPLLEADETGFELYRRAALPTSEYLGQIVEEDDTKVCREFLAQGKVPNRDRSSHPAPCWRIYNIERESREHKDQYDRYEERSAVLFPGELEQVKEAIATYK